MRASSAVATMMSRCARAAWSGGTVGVASSAREHAQALELLGVEQLRVGRLELARALGDEVLEAIAVPLELDRRGGLLGDVGQVDGQPEDGAVFARDGAVHVLVDAPLHPLVAVLFLEG